MRVLFADNVRLWAENCLMPTGIPPIVAGSSTSDRLLRRGPPGSTRTSGPGPPSYQRYNSCRTRPSSGVSSAAMAGLSRRLLQHNGQCGPVDGHRSAIGRFRGRVLGCPRFQSAKSAFYGGDGGGSKSYLQYFRWACIQLPFSLRHVRRNIHCLDVEGGEGRTPLTPLDVVVTSHLRSPASGRRRRTRPEQAAPIEWTPGRWAPDARGSEVPSRRRARPSVSKSVGRWL